MTKVENLLSGMTLEEKVGQLFQIGFTGTTVTPEIKEMIENYYVGGIIYFRQNIESLEQIASLSNELQKIAINSRNSLPLIISTDQEGGTVTRLTGGTHFPGNMTLGASRDANLAYKAGQMIARELKAVGINMDLAPVLDVNNNHENPVIGVRSYGEEPELVAKLGIAFMQGMQEEGVIACGKHFPGHGDTAADSHLALPIVKHERKRLEEIELYPFKKAIEAGIDSLMTAHIYFPTIEPKKGIPATLSSKVLRDLLRKELGFEGLIITDSMGMNAIANTFGTVEGSIMTIEAGSDLVLVSHILEQQKAAIKAVIEAVKEGRITEERIDRSVTRVLRLKERRIGLQGVSPLKLEYLNKKESERVAYQIAREGVTLVKDEQNLIPLKKTERVMVFDFKMGRLVLVEDNSKYKNPLVDYLKKEGVMVEYYSFSGENSELPSLAGFDRVILCTYDAVHNQEQVDLVKKIKKADLPLIVVAIRNPYDLQVLPEVSTFLTTYDFSPANLRVASEIIAGKYKARGVLPVTIDY